MANRRSEAVAGARERPEGPSVAEDGDATVPSGLLVFSVLIATMLGFAGSMVYSAHVGSKLDENAVSIATDASPAIEHLSAARGEVLRIQLAAVSALEHFTEGMPVDRAPFDNSLSSLHRELTAYLALPFYPDEHEHYFEVERAVRRYQTLLRAQNRLTEARAREVAEFGSRLESLIAASMKISETITTIDDTRKVFQTIADEGRALTNAQYSAVGVGTDPGRSFDPWVSSGMSAAAAEALGRAPRADGLLGAVIREGRLIRLADLRDHPAFRGLPAHHPPMGPFLGVPIVHDGRNVGNLYLSRTEGALPFSERDERAARLLAGFVGVSISNSRLYNEAMAAKRAREDLLATVSHDLKNPLSTIRISTHLLRRSAEPGTVNLAERIDRTAERMTRLIGDLLDASKIEAGVLGTAAKPEAAAALVDSAMEIFRPMAGEKSIQLHSQVPSSLLAVVCERDLVLRVFSNLIGNAIKFSPEGSSIIVAAKPMPGEVQFSVTDSGPGIPAGHLPHVFDRYWQEKGGDRRGSGLGLYIAKGIVEAHGGRIWLESAPGRGTTMFFTLPNARRSDDARAP